MANNNAIGLALEIPESVFNQIKKAQNAIVKLEEQASSSANKINKSFLSLSSGGLESFIKKLKEAQGLLSGFKLGDTNGIGTQIKGIQESAKGAASSIVEVANAVNRLGGKDAAIKKIADSIKAVTAASSSGSSANTSVLAWEGLQKNIDMLNARQTELLKTTREYEQTLSRIQSGKGGILSNEQTTAYNSAVKELEANKATIESYRQKQQEVVNYQQRLAEQERLVKSLREYEQESASLSSQRSKDELNQLNAYYKELEKTTAAEKKRTDRAESKKIAQQEKENAAAINQYERALSASANTIVQRKNKIDKLAEAEKRLVATGQATSERLQKIRTETAKLNAENTKAAKSTDTLRKSQKSLLNTADQLKRAVALVFSVSQIRGYVTNLARVRGEFELQNKALAAILQNKDEADRLFNQITELAVRSPFQLKELVTYTKQLSAYRIESDKLYDTTKMLADVSAGLGVEVGRLILAYGQIKAAGYLRGSETRQLTEAGVNVLGELADYYSELEGRIVSVNEVMDRQFKRMISFQDVEQIFKRLTSEGGIFYNMQEIQADTLSGMISNLRDSIDIMLNEIGKSTEGSMKSAITVVKTLIDNYQVVETVLKAVSAGFAVYAVRAIAASVANAKLAKSTSAAAARLLEMRKAQGIGTAFEKFGKSLSMIKLNPLMLAVTLITGIVVALVKFNKKVKEARKEYDTFSKSLISSKDTLNGLVSGIEEQTRALNEAKAEMSSLEQGTEAYANASDRAAKAEKERNTLLVKLKRDFPEVAAGYDAQTDNIDALVQKQKEYNDELRSTLSLNYLMQQGEGWFDKGIIKDFAALSAAAKDFEKESQNLSGAYDAIRNKVEGLLVTNERLNQKYGEQIRGILDSNMSEYEKLTELYTILNSFSGASGTLPVPSILALSSEIKEVTKATDALKQSYTATMREAQKETQRLVDTALKDANGDVEKARKNIENFIRSLPSMADKTMQEFVNKELKVRIGFTIDFSTAPKELDWFQKEIEQYRKDNKLTLVPEVTVDKTTDTYFKSLNDKIKENEAEIEKLTIATQQLNETATNEQRIEDLEKENRQYIQLLKAFGEYKDEESKSVSGGNDAALKTLNERINLIKEMNKEYENLLKYYSEEEAAMKVRDTFKETADELGMSSLVATMSFDANGVLSAFNQLMQGVVKNVEGLSQEQVNKLILNLKKAIDNYSVSIGIDERIKENEGLSKTIDELFTAYELTKEMKDLGIDESIAEKLFGFETTNIEDLRREIKKLRSEAMGEEAMQIYQKALDKIEELEEKMLKERMKQYSEYLEWSMNERVKIEKEAQKLISEIPAEGFTQEQQVTIKRNIEREKQQKIAELDWEDLKATDLYKMSFEDLERIGTATLERMIRELEAFAKASGQYLDTTSFKELTTNIKNLRNEIESRNPFKTLVESIKDYKDAVEDLERLQNLGKGLEGEQSLAEKNLEEARSQYENAQGIDEQSAAYERLIIAEANLAIANENIVQSDNKVANAENKKAIAMFMAQNAVDDITSSYSKFESTISSAVSIVQEFAEGIGYTFSDETNEAIEAFSKGVGIVGSALSAVLSIIIAVKLAGDAAMTTLLPLAVIGAALGATFAIIKSEDNKRQKAIDAELDKIEQLEKAYEKLAEAMENALSIPDMIGNYEQSLENINKQIASYQQAIAVEQSRKNPDEDNLKEWQDSIEDLYEQQEELYETMISNLGGFGSQSNMKSAAQEFADAWLDAYKETGDGLSALMDKWDEYFDNIVAQQLMLRGTEKFLEPIMSQVDRMLEDGRFTAGEYEKIQSQIDEVMPQLNEFWKSIADSFDLNTDSGEMSGLQKGIESITETTAQALEALLNSVRFFVADSNTQLHTLVGTLTATEGYPNPMLDELRNQTRIMTSIQNMLSSVMKTGHPQGGYGIKTFMD